MNRTGITIAVIVILVLIGFAVWGGDAEAPTNTEDETSEMVQEDREELSGTASYEVSSEESLLLWEAKKTLLVNYRDAGVLSVKEGTVAVEDGDVVGATIVFDMTSIEGQDTSNTNVGVDRLTGHLMSDDFFNVEMYPEATLVVTDVQQEGDAYVVTGDLTLLDVTESITFPAEIFTVEGDLVVEALVTVDRTAYGITFGSGSFFEDLGDNVIDDEFTVQVRLVAEAASE